MIASHLYWHASFSWQSKRQDLEFCSICLTFSFIFADENPWQIPNWRRTEGSQKKNYSFFARWKQSTVKLRFFQKKTRSAFRHFHAQAVFVRTPSYTTTLHCFINCHSPPRLNQFVVCHVSGRLAERDLSNMIESLWVRAEESREEIFC